MGVPKLLEMDAAKAAGLREDEQRLVDAFRVAGAVSPERAQSLGQLGLARSETFSRLETDRVLRLVGRNLYYLDESAIVPKQDAAVPGSKTPTLVVALLMVAAVLALVVFLTYSR